jgi:hypothetical protein
MTGMRVSFTVIRDNGIFALIFGRRSEPFQMTDHADSLP